MKKIIKLTESDIRNIVKSILKEQTNINPKNLKFGDGGRKDPKKAEDVKELQQKLIDSGFLKLKNKIPTGYFGTLTQDALSVAQGLKPKSNNNTQKEKPKSNNNTQTEKTTSYCQSINSKSDITDLNQIIDSLKKSYPSVEPFGLLNRTINRFASSYIKQGIPNRTACEVALIQIRPGYKDKNAFIVDSLDKLLYLYDSEGKFIAKTPMISGVEKQSSNPKTIAAALLTWNDKAKNLGFEWVRGKGYVDTTGKNRKYNHDIVYDEIAKSGGRFLPKGIYTTSSKMNVNKDYAGSGENVLHLMKGNDLIAQAVHGYYREQPREEALRRAERVLSNPEDPKVSQEFMNLVSKGKINLSQSYGCFNVPESFVPYLTKYGPNSYVFNLSEDQKNYLVQNTENYFNKVQNSQSCPSPQSLGAIEINNMV